MWQAIIISIVLIDSKGEVGLSWLVRRNQKQSNEISHLHKSSLCDMQMTYLL